MPKKLTLEIVKQQIEAIHENITVPIEQKYIDTKTKIKYICKYHGEKMAKPTDLKYGYGCPNCGHESRAEKQKSNWFDVKQQIEAIHENITVPFDQPFINNKTKIKYICKYHGEKMGIPKRLKKDRGCPDCGIETRKYKIKSNWFDVIKDIEAIHENIIIPVDQEYINNHTKIKYICKYHGEKTATPGDLKSGRSCPECAGNQKLTLEIVKQQVEAIHENIIVPLNQKFINVDTKIKYICKFHGEKSATPASLKIGRGCSDCGSESKTEKQKSNWFDVIKDIELNSNITVPINQEYINGNTKIKIICKKHGEHWALPSFLIRAIYGCPECAFELNPYSKTGWIEGCKKANGNAEIYWIKMIYNNQSWYKFGITYRGLKKRFQSKEYKDINIQLVKIVSGEPEYIWDWEHRLHRLYYKSRLSPPIEFGGDNECYKIVDKSL